jgi:hypothetical protein
MSLPENIWQAAASKVNNPSRAHNIASWGGDKWRKNKKIGNIIKTGTTVGTSFVKMIPIPLWTSGVDYVVQKVEGKVRNHYRSQNLNNAEKPIKKIKHGIKSLDISKLDRARYKAQHALSSLGKDTRGTIKGLSKCIGVYQYAIRFHYARTRMYKLRFQAEVMKQLSKNTLSWCDAVEKTLAIIEPQIIHDIGNRLNHDPSQCGGPGASAGCFNAEGNDAKLAQSLSKLIDLPELDT